MNKRYQGGSLIGFIVVGVLLGLVLIGGLYGLNRYNAQKAAETAAASEDKTDETSTKVATENATKDENKTEKPANSGAATPRPEATGTTDATQVGGTTADSGMATQGASSNLPQTGPADTAGQLLAVVSLALATAYYIRSRSRA